MTHKGESNQIVLAVASAAPLFYGVRGVWPALFVIAAIALAILFFEILFYFLKPFWFRSLRQALALLVTSSVLAAAFLIYGRFVETSGQTISSFPLALLSAFLLTSQTISQEVLTFKKRLRAWIGFAIFVFVIGAFREWKQAFWVFWPAPFWIGGAMLALFLFIRKKAGLS